MARQETKYIVIHCSQTRPSQKDVDAKWIDRVHRERGWTMIGYGKVIKRNGTGRTRSSRQCSSGSCKRI